MSARPIHAVKMSGAGNDFLVLDAEGRSRIEGDAATWARRVCRRGLSVGADGVLFVEPGGPGRVRVQFLNPDGSAAFCGNGSRCAARFASLRGMVRGRHLVLETLAGEVEAELRDDRVRLSLPPPADSGPVELSLSGRAFEGRWIRAGSPHCVVFVDDPGRAPLTEWGPQVRRDPRFGEEGVNFDVARWEAGTVVLRTWERGVEAETLACGSGAVASAFAARLAGAPDVLTVIPASGIPLEVGLPGAADAPRAARLEGDARIVFEGELPPESTSGFG